MYNWSTNTTELEKDPHKYTIWKLEQMINFGLDGEKLDKKELENNLHILNIDPKRKEVLTFWLYDKLNLN